MFKAYFANMEWTALPLFALGLFLTMFVLMLLRTFAFKRVTDYDSAAALPLHDGSEIPSHEVQP